jgi:ABC-type antimicrobial peptide transport system permease subunit
MPQFLIRTEREPETIAAAVRAEFRSIIGNVTLRERMLSDHIDSSIVRERMVTKLSAIFGGLALLLAVIGLYGVVHASVAGRTREIGIRMALGFDGRRAVSMVLREVLALVGGGIVLGLPLAIVVTRSAGSLLYGLAPDDPSTVIGAVAALLLSALAAGFIPADVQPASIHHALC